MGPVIQRTILITICASILGACGSTDSRRDPAEQQAFEQHLVLGRRVAVSLASQPENLALTAGANPQLPLEVTYVDGTSTWLWALFDTSVSHRCHGAELVQCAQAWIDDHQIEIGVPS